MSVVIIGLKVNVNVTVQTLLVLDIDMLQFFMHFWRLGKFNQAGSK